MSHNVHVKLKADKCLEGIIQDRVSFFITTLSSIARENCIESNKLTVKNTENLPEFVPYFSAKYAIKRASSDSSFILNTGMVIATDNE